MNRVAESRCSRSGELKCERENAIMESQEIGRCAHILAVRLSARPEVLREMLVAIAEKKRSNRHNCFQDIGRDSWRRLSLWNPQEWLPIQWIG